MASKDLKILSVHMWGKEVGRLFWDERQGKSTFAFSKAFNADGWDIAPILYPEGGPERMRPMWGIKAKPFRGLPSFLADSLPDDWGHLLFSTSQDGRIFANPLERLSYIGKRGMGAFEFVPEAPNGIADEKVDIQKMRDLAEKIYRDREDAVIDKDEELSIEKLRRIGSPPGGRQPKAVIAIDEAGNIRSGQVPGGFRYYILKFQPEDHPSAANIEMTYHDLALRCGISMMPSRLYPIGDSTGFLTERYDRESRTGEKIHTQTLAALNPNADSYEDLFRATRKIGVPEDELRELYVRTVFNFLACNTDDHSKNMTFLLRKGGTWHLSPAYDITYTIDPQLMAYQQEHCLSLKGKRIGVTLDDLASFGREMGIRSPESVIASVSEGLTHLREAAVFYGVPMIWIDRMEKNVAACLPKEYSARMQGFAGTPVEAYETPSGLSVSGIRFEETMSGNLHLLADIEGREYKYVIGKKSALWEEIVRNGANRMPPEEKKRLADSLLVPKAERNHGIYQAQTQSLQEKGLVPKK